MTTLLLDQFPLLASAPNGLPHIRALVLDLAMSGRLTDSAPGDQGACVLLAETNQRRSQAVRKVRSSGDGTSEPHPNRPTWITASLGTLALKLTDGSHNPPRDNGSGIPMLSSQNIGNGTIDFVGASRFLTPEDFESEDARTTLAPGDVLLTIVASIGRSAVVGAAAPRFALQRSVAVIRSLLVPAYLSLYLRSPVALSYFWRHAKGTAQKGIYLGKLAELEVAVPPLDEQHRIVAKVDELMALCDRLEARQQDAEAAHAQLVQALLDSLTQARGADEFLDCWRRLAGQIHGLFTTEPSIDSLKKTVLSLSIKGCLVPQVATNEVATSVLARTSAMRAGITRLPVMTRHAVSAADAPELPTGWISATVADVTVCRDGERVPVSQVDRDHRAKIYDYYGASGVIDKIDGFLFDKPMLLVGEDGANLINRSTPIAFIARGKYWVNNHAHVLDACSETVLAYMALYFNAIDLKPYVTGTAQPKLNQAKLNSIRVALPPEEEQRRIVAKVTELLAHCDQLKARIAAARAKHAQLAEALVEQAVA